MVTKIGIQSLACIGLSAVFGVTAATNQITPSTRADAYLFNLLMDPLEKMDPESPEWGAAGRRFFASKMWAIASAGPFIAEHLKSLEEFPPSQGADTLSMKKALDETMRKLESSSRGKN